MGKGILLYEEDPNAGAGAGDPLADVGEDAGAGAGGAAGGEGEGAGGDPLADGGAVAAAEPEKPDTQAALAAAIGKLSERLDAKPGQAPLSPEQQEAIWQDLEAKSGMTRQQLQWQDQQSRRTAVLANLETNKELGKMKAEKIVDDPEMLAVIEKTMLALPPEAQANPKTWEDAAYLELGRATRNVKKNNDGKGQGTTGAGAGTQRRIIGGSTGTAGQTRGAAAAKPAAKKEYPAFEQHIINRQFAGSAEEYEKYKGKTSIDNDVRVTAGTGAGAADKELERLTRDNT